MTQYIAAEHARGQGIPDKVRQSAPRYAVLDDALAAAVKLAPRCGSHSGVAVVVDDGTSSGGAIDAKEFAKTPPTLKEKVRAKRVSVGLHNSL